MKHAIAFDEDNTPSGAIFSITCDTDKSYCEVGWIFTCARISKRERLFIIDKLFNETHEMILKIGFKKIIVEFGTQEGQLLLSKKYGYTKNAIER